MRRLVFAVALALTVAACSGGSDNSSGGGVEADAPDATPATEPDAVETAASAASPMGNVLVHTEDSDGEKAPEGSEFMLLFEPDDVATLYAQNDEQILSAHGSWSYADGELTLSFAHDLLTIDATGAFDLGAETVTLPFRLIEGVSDGTSEWQRRPADPITDLRMVFRAAVTDELDPRDTADAVERATAYAQAIIDLDSMTVGNRARPAADPTATKPVKVSPLTNGVQVEYSDGTTAQALVFSWAPAATAPLSLSTAALAGDPRVHLNSLANGHTQDDPPNKDALFIVPLKSGRINDWWDRLTNSARDSGIVGSTADPFNLDTTASKLEERGYTVSRYFNEDACVKCLIDAFAAHSSPGYVMYNTHGSSNGYLLTGDQLTHNGDYVDALLAYSDFREKLRSAGYGTLVDTPGALSMMSIETEMKVPQGVEWFVAVGPAFWGWLRDNTGVDFSHSLFYAAACEIDNEPAVREAIAARAFFGFKTSISPDLAGAIHDYLVEHLARRTRSAEEAFYNIVRVVNTGEMIYAEDKLLDGVMPTDESGSTPIFSGSPEDFLFNGYASDGASSPLPFATNGWFDTGTLSQTQVWWLMFAARWNENVDEGVSNLISCHSEWWSQGDYGGLGSPFCNAANDGDLPTEADIGYATYLMTGSAALSTTQPLPRFTLNEGG